jgi:primary-amine oxidase
VTHPLDALTADEVTAATRILKESGALPDGTLFPLVELDEPVKGESRADRRVRYVGYDRVGRTAYDAVVSVTENRVVRADAVPGAQPLLLMFTELYHAGELVRNDPDFQAAVRARGVDDMSQVQIDPWPAGAFGLDFEKPGRRLARAVAYHRHTADDNGYAHPFDNLLCVIDLDEMTMVQVIDEGAVPVPQACSNYTPGSVASTRAPLKPLEITQPEGPSYVLNGNHLTWDRWSLRFSLHTTEALVLHDVSYDGRPVLHRASLAEMVVPYAGTATNTWWKNTFDAGEMSVGKMVNSLELGCDCLGEITYSDAVLVDEYGNPYTAKNAICIHEEDIGILWKHTDLFVGHAEVRRNRRLVVSCITTVGNYEYAFYWYFYLDGRIQLEIKLSGVMQTEALAGREDPKHVRRIGPELVAPHHQHLFCIRLDMDVDGAPNSVYEVEVVPAQPGPDNPYANAWEVAERRLESERDAVRDCDATTGRYWKVASAQGRNGFGEPTAYALVPQAAPSMLAHESSAVAQRATFGRHHLWVTAYDPTQRHAAGDHPNQHAGGDGLPRWIEADRPLVDTDVVLWHSFGSTHVARPEDWPVMPVESVGFTLKPVGFFDRNPTLDLAPPDHCH